MVTVESLDQDATEADLRTFLDARDSLLYIYPLLSEGQAEEILLWNNGGWFSKAVEILCGECPPKIIGRSSPVRVETPSGDFYGWEAYDSIDGCRDAGLIWFWRDAEPCVRDWDWNVVPI